jgi:NAD(P)-dependent dehydrogenase (short-subunit alcohol dehydrogenase family)
LGFNRPITSSPITSKPVATSPSQTKQKFQEKESKGGSIMNRFVGKVALVTGAASGMGAGIAIAFAKEGASVAITDINEDGLGETMQAIRSLGTPVVAVKADVSSAEQVEDLLLRTRKEFGDLHASVNAAAIEGESCGLADLDVETFDRIQTVNVRSVFLCMKFQIQAMQSLGHGGTIVNFASTNSYRPQIHQSAYTASKFAVLGLTKSAAIDYAKFGIRINAICPGAIETPMLRNAIERRKRNEQDVISRLSLLDRFGTVDEISNAALWLSSEESTFTIGHALAVDGGYLAR